TVALKISSGEVEVPPVEGKPLEEARSILTGDELGLTVSVVTVETDDHPENTVFEQMPAAGSSVTQGSEVELKVAIPKPEPTPTPSPSETETQEDEETDSESPTPENDDEDSEAGPSRGWFSNDGQEHGPWNHGIGWGSD